MKKNNISILPIDDDNKRKVQIIIENDANIITEDYFYNTFNEIFDNFDYFYIKLVNIETFDLSFLQLLISIKKTISKTNKSVEFELNLPDNIKTVLSNSGVDINSLFEIKNN
jgi:hypothetical protein